MGFFMKRFLPGRNETVVFAVVAIVLALVVSQFSVEQHDTGLALFTAPLFIFAAVLGLRRSPQWQTQDVE